MTGGIARLVNVKQLFAELQKEGRPGVTHDSNIASLTRLEDLSIITARKGRAGFIMVKLNPVAITHIHENQPGIPQFYTRNIEVLTTNELQSLRIELEQRLATSEVGSRDYTPVKEKMGQIEYRLGRLDARHTKRLAVWSLIVAILAALGTIAHSLLPQLIASR